MHYLKIYGERNTGTNWVRRLVELNLAVEIVPGVAPTWIRYITNKYNSRIRDNVIDYYFQYSINRNLGWKHCNVDNPLLRKIFAKKDSKYYTIISLTKNPYSWLLSLYDESYHVNFDNHAHGFLQFLQFSWKPVNRELLAKTLTNAISTWNLKNGAYIKNDKIVKFRYEDLVRSPDLLVDKLECLPRKSSEFINMEKCAKRTNKSFEDYSEYYLSEKWKKRLTRESIEFINKRLDPDVMTYFSYNFI